MFVYLWPAGTDKWGLFIFVLQVETSDVYFRSAGWDSSGLLVFDLQVETIQVCLFSICTLRQVRFACFRYPGWNKWGLFLICLSEQVRFACFRSAGSQTSGGRSWKAWTVPIHPWFNNLPQRPVARKGKYTAQWPPAKVLEKTRNAFCKSNRMTSND